MRRLSSMCCLSLLTIVFGSGFTAAAQAATGPRTIRVNVSSTGAQANNTSSGSLFRPAAAAVSSDGRYVAFVSAASNLVPGDTNGVEDVFLRDVVTGRTRRVSVSSSGAQANSSSGAPAISADGRYVAFQSDASNLVPGTILPAHDAVFVRDMVTGRTRRVSVSSTGTQANADSREPAISADGRYVAFHTSASNLVPGDTNASADVFVHDLVTGQTQRVSVDSAGAEADNASFGPSISGDGRYVAFNSDATNLVPDDTNQATDAFVHDLVTGQTQRVSVDSTGAQASSDFHTPPVISESGRYVAFDSDATNLVPGDTNGAMDVFVHDLATGQTQRVSVDSTGAQANNASFGPSISGDGRYVTFLSGATNLVPGDTNGWADVFVHDVVTGPTRRVNLSSTGTQANNYSTYAAISGDGRYVAFASAASNLVPRDTNGFTDIFRRDLVR